MLRNIQSKINLKIQSLADLPIQSLCNMYLNQLEEDNRNLRRQNKQMEIVLDQIQARKAENQEAIKAKIQKLTHPKKRKTQKIIDPEGAQQQ